MKKKNLLIIIHSFFLFKIITPYIPTSKPQLEPSIYEQVLDTYLKQKKYDVCIEEIEKLDI